MIITDFGVAIIEDDSHLSKWIVEHGRLDIARGYLDLFRNHIPDGGVVLDVGACLGDHTATYSEFVGPMGAVYAFEPNPQALPCLRVNMAKYANVTVFPYALGSSFMDVAVKPDKFNNLGANQIVPGGELAMMPLDAFTFPRLDFIKIDAEGYEPDILVGGEATMKKHRPVMLIEVNRPILEARGFSPDKVYAILDSMNYSYRPAEPHLSFGLPMVDVICQPK